LILLDKKENGVSSIFGPITTLFNYFNESKIELTPFLFYFCSPFNRGRAFLLIHFLGG